MKVKRAGPAADGPRVGAPRHRRLVLRAHDTTLAGRRALRAQITAAVWWAGSALGLLGLLAPSSGFEADVVGGLCALGILAGALVLWRFERFSEIESGTSVALGTATIAVAAVVGSTTDGPVPLVFLWNVVFAFAFLERRHAFGQLALLAGAYGTVLAVEPPTTPAVAQWLIAVVTWTVVGSLIATLRWRLELAADTDHLTGLLNRGGFERRAAAELARARRSGASVGVVVLDLDGFKRVNDEQGHPAGDEVLRCVASTLRGSDDAGRLGGDEFAVLLPDVDLAGASAAAARVRDRLAVGASVGVAVAPVDGATLDELLSAADKRLYAQKARRVVGGGLSGR